MSYDDNRKLTGKGHYDLTITRGSDFEIEEDFEEVVQATANREELNQVVDNYKKILSGFFQKEMD